MTRVSVNLAKFKTLQTFDRLWQSLGRAPSIRELSREMGMTPLGAQRTLNNLIDDGDILAKTRTVRKPYRLSAAGRRRLEQAKTER